MFLRLFLLLILSINISASPIPRVSSQSIIFPNFKTDKEKKEHLEKEDKKSFWKKLYYFVGLYNDNFFLPEEMTDEITQTGNDFGRTHSMFAEASWQDLKYDRVYTINFTTSLFTNFISARRRNGRTVYTQTFREITTANLSFQQMVKTNFYIRPNFEVGLINDDRPINGLALWQQSGRNGDKGIHRVIGVDWDLENQSSGGRHLFAGTGMAIGFVDLMRYSPFSFIKRLNMTFETGLRLRTWWDGSMYYALAKIGHAFIKTKGRDFLTFYIQEKINWFFEESSTGLENTFGINIQGEKLGFEFNYTIPTGNQNPAFYRYTDKDQIVNLTLFYRL